MTPTLAMNPADDTGTVGDNITIITDPRFIGVTDPGVTVELLKFDTTTKTYVSFNPAVTTTSAPDGSFTLTFPNPQKTLGDFSVEAKATNLKGSTTSAAVNFTIQAPGPNLKPNLTMLPADDSGTKGDNITNVVNPHFIGVTDPGVKVELLDASGNPFSPHVTTTSDAVTGAFVLQFPTQNPTDGTFVIEAAATNADGTTLGNPLTFTIKTAGPTVVPTLNLDPNDDSGIVGDNITNVRKPHFTGTVSSATEKNPNAIIRLYKADANGKPDGSGSVADACRRQRQLLVHAAPARSATAISRWW